jgi:V/A-type H+-transporting ATPase subunit E
MESKISQLTEKLLNEGVEKGNEEKAKIIAAAESKATSIVENAKKEASKLLATAKEQAADQLKTGNSELKLAGEQAISVLKQKITDLLVLKSVDESAAASLADPKVMTEYIKTALTNWKGDATSVELLLPEAQRANLEGSLEKAVKGTLKGDVTISFGKAVKGGFQIAPVGESYKITLSDEDFSGFFKEYLRPRVRSILFGE